VVLGLFEAGQDTAAATGHFVHVYVDRETRRPVAQLPEDFAAALQRLRVDVPPAA